MKVCHMTSAHKSQDVRILKKQCTSLAKAGYEVYLVAPGDSYEENGVRVIGVGENVGGRLKRMTQMSKRVYKKALELNCDIYQMHDPELLAHARKLKRRGKKVIFDSHENYAVQISAKAYIPKPFRKAVSAIYGRYQDRIFKKIDAVIFPCLKNGKHIFEGKCKNVITLGNEPMLEELYDNYVDDKRKNSTSVCYSGGLTYIRGVSHIIKACYASESKLILAGNFTPESFKQEMMNSKEYECVDYRGFCSRDEILKIYAECSVGACNLLNVGQYNDVDHLATKVYEYMSMGLPVVLTDYAYARKINEKYNFAVLIQPDDIEEIAQAIKYLKENPDIAYEMGQNGRRAILEEFNWGKEEKKLLQLYSAL